MTRETSIRLNLDNSGYLSNMRAAQRETRDMTQDIRYVGNESEQTARKASTMGTVLQRGFAGARSGASQLVGQLKTVLSTAVTLGGALSFGAAAREAINLTDSYDDMAFNVNKVAGNLVTAKQIQDDVEGSADRTKTRIGEMRDAYDAVFRTTKDLKFTRVALDVIGEGATASGEKVLDLANAAQILQRKFKVTAEELPEAMAKFIEKTGVGGKSLADLSAGFGIMAGEASDAGLKGATGVSTLLGLLNELDSSAAGEQLDVGFKMLFRTLKDGSSQLNNIKKQSAIKFTADTNAFDKIKEILQNPKARKAAEAIITADARVIFDELAKPFDAAVKRAQDAGRTEKEARVAGAKAFDRALDDASKSAMKFADVHKQFEGAKGGTREKLNDALNKMEQAFSRPQMIAAIDKLADLAPQLAEALVKLLDMAVAHPALAAGIGIGGKIGLDAAGSALGAGASIGAGAAWKGAKKLLTKGGAKAAAGALEFDPTIGYHMADKTGKVVGGSASTVAANAVGGAAGVGALASLKALLGMSVGGLATAGAGTLAAAGGLLTASAGSGALIGYGTGKLIIDPRLKDKNQDLLQLSMASRGGQRALESGSREEMMKARQELFRQVLQSKENSGGWRDAVFGGTAKLFGAKDANAEGLARAQEQLKKLDEALGSNTKTHDNAGRAVRDFTVEMGRATGELRKLTKPDGNNGLPPPPANKSGSG